jgi:predicted phage terminase large subunit-like protein
MQSEKYYKSECRPTSVLRKLWETAKTGITFQQWLELRDRCRKDLFFLAKDVLGWTRVIERVHQPVCEFFGEINFDGVYHDGYTLEEMQEAIKRQGLIESLLLDPRGAFKSTINSANCVRWLLNAPDIRIFIVTGEYDNAVLFLQQIKNYFYLAEDAEPTKLQMLFPEYILTGKDGYSESPLECPARIHTEQKESSLWVNAITATLASQHCDLLVGDDVVSDRNSTTPEARQKLKNKFDNAQNLLDEWGLQINIGTRYAGDDYYGERIKIMGDGDAPLNYFCRAAWTVKKPFLHIPIKELTKDMVELLFPEKLTWAVLRKKLLNNERDFRCQQLNEPQQDADAIHFTEEMLRAHMEQLSAAPTKGDIVMTLDWALTSTEKADYSCLAVGRIDKEAAEAHVLEIEYGRWKSSELAANIVRFQKKFNPRVVLVEKIGGSELMQNEIQREAKRQGVAINILWNTVDVSHDAKANRIKGLETLLKEDRLFFVQGPWIDETFAQFMRYTGLRKNKGRKDDIPDAVSMLQFFLPKEANDPVDADKLAKEQEDERKKAALESYYRQVFNRQPGVSKNRLDYDERTGNPRSTSSQVGLNQAQRRSRFDFGHLGRRNAD